MSYIKSYRGQNYLLPPNLTDLFPKNHVCYFIEKITDSLNYSNFDTKYAGAGHPAYHPRINLKLLLMASVDSIKSSRKIAKNACRDAVYIYLSEKVKLDFRTISNFRKNNYDLLKQVSIQLTKFAHKNGLIDLSQLSVDGTTIKADANKFKCIDKETLEKLSRYIDNQIKEGIKVDEEEDKLYGERGMHELPEEFNDEEKRNSYVQEIVEEVNKSMKEGKKEETEKIKQDIDNTNQALESRNQKKFSPTDPDSRIMMNKKGGNELSYNAQIVVDKNGLIIHNDVVQEADDRNQLVPCIDGVEENFGKLEGSKVLADKGYEKAKDLKKLDDKGYDIYVPGKKSKKAEFKYDEKKDVYISPNGEILKKTGTYFNKKRGERLTIYKGIVDGKERVIHAIPEDKLLNRIKDKLETPLGKKILRQRQIVEKSFGDIKHNRGLRSFSLRGIQGAKTEFGLSCTASNLVRINNMIQKPPS